jgi:hypothetical protein
VDLADRVAEEDELGAPVAADFVLHAHRHRQQELLQPEDSFLKWVFMSMSFHGPVTYVGAKPPLKICPLQSDFSYARIFRPEFLKIKKLLSFF